jgi:predicted RNase H-like nuclease (RuvC/YqgF family)
LEVGVANCGSGGSSDRTNKWVSNELYIVKQENLDLREENEKLRKEVKSLKPRLTNSIDENTKLKGELFELKEENSKRRSVNKALNCHITKLEEKLDKQNDTKGKIIYSIKDDDDVIYVDGEGKRITKEETACIRAVNKVEVEKVEVKNTNVIMHQNYSKSSFILFKIGDEVSLNLMGKYIPELRVDGEFVKVRVLQAMSVGNDYIMAEIKECKYLD